MPQTGDGRKDGRPAGAGGISDTAGEAEDFSGIYDRYFSRVYGFVLSQVANPVEADDVVSRVFERILDRLPSFHPERGAFESWLFTVARNAVRDYFRARRWRSLLFLEEPAAEPASREPAIEDGLVAAEERARLLRALRGLDKRAREILGLKFQAGLTNRQIAEVLDLGESHIGVLVYRAVKELQAALGDRP